MIVPGRVNISVQQIDAPNAHPAIVPMGANGDMKILIVGGMTIDLVLAGQIIAANPNIGCDFALAKARELIEMQASKSDAQLAEPAIQTR